MMLKMKYFGALAGCALATGSLCAASVTNTFDTAEAVGGWTGDCARSTTESNYVFSAASVAGFPTGKASPLSGNYVLTVEGVATNGVSAGSTPLVDMMVQAARPDEELELPSEDAESVHIAVAVDSTGCFNAYCKTNASNAGWVKISDTQFDEDAWVRVSLLFDYTNERCQIRLNGEPVKSNYGFLRESGDTTGGAWYNLANGSSASLVKVVGCTAIDEYVLNDAGEYQLVAGAKTSDGVSCEWLDQYGLAWDSTTAGTSYDGTGMTVAEKYDACLSPFDGQTFEVKSVTADTTKTVVGIPETVDTVGRKVVLQYGSTTEMTETPIEVAPGQTTVEVPLPAAGAVQYFRLHAEDK